MISTARYRSYSIVAVGGFPSAEDITDQAETITIISKLNLHIYIYISFWKQFDVIVETRTESFVLAF